MGTQNPTLLDHLTQWLQSYNIPDADIEPLSILIQENPNLALVKWNSPYYSSNVKVTAAIYHFAMKDCMTYLEEKYPAQTLYFAILFELLDN